LRLSRLEGCFEHINAGLDGSIQRQLPPFRDEGLLGPNRGRARCHDGIAGIVHSLIESVGLNHFLDQSPREGLGGVNQLTGKHQPPGPAPSDQLRQERGLDHRRDPDLHLGHAHTGVRCRDPEVARGRDLESAPQAIAAHAGNYRDRKPADGITGEMQVGDEGARGCRIASGHFGDVHTANQCAVAGAAQHNHAEIVVRCQSVECDCQVPAHCPVDDIQRGGAIDRHRRDGSTFVPT
tara:strand:+ start:3443 stop:4153 length:711 start_codon:yes stop_codon:yes gene_type:complete